MDVWLVLALASPLIGFATWLAFTAGHGFLYLEGFRDKLAFFFSPWMPRWYVLLKHVDGSVEQFFDVRVEKGRGRYLLRLGSAGEVMAVMEKDPDEVAVPLSIWDARGPPGMPSPYGLGWRVLVGWAVAVYIAFLAFDFTFIGARGGPGVEGWLSLMVFMLEFSYMWQLLREMQLPRAKYLGLVAVGVNPPHLRVVPELSVFDPRPPAAMLEMLARRMEIVVPRELGKIIEKLKERLGTDEAVAAWIAAQAEMATIWRKSLAEVRSEMTTVRTVARRMVRMQGLRELFRPSLGKVMVWLLIFGLGAVIGYVFGSSWALSASPPPWYNVTAHSTYNTMYTQKPPVSPAAPPAPPGAQQAQTTVTPTPVGHPSAPPPPGPPATGNATAVRPAQPPPPP